MYIMLNQGYESVCLCTVYSIWPVSISSLRLSGALPVPGSWAVVSVSGSGLLGWLFFDLVVRRVTKISVWRAECCLVGEIGLFWKCLRFMAWPRCDRRSGFCRSQLVGDLWLLCLEIQPFGAELVLFVEIALVMKTTYQPAMWRRSCSLLLLEFAS